jgi:hypothetical protein
MEVSAKLTPVRVAIFFTSVDTPDTDINEVISEVVDDAEARGLFFEWAAVGGMDINDVPQGSQLHQAMTGHFPDR